MNRIERARTLFMRVPIDREKIYSFNEASVILGVTRPTLTRYLTSGKVNGKKIGGKWFITGESINIALDPTTEKRLNCERPHDIPIAESSS